MSQCDDPEVEIEVVPGPVTGLYPNMAVSPYPVNNIKGQTFGNITAGGNFAAAANSSVYVIAVPGGAIPGANLPAIPMPGSVLTHTDANGDWSRGDVPTALCRCSAPHPQSQVIAWGLNSNGTYSIASAYFTGQSVNC